MTKELTTSDKLSLARGDTDTNPTQKEIKDDSYDKGRVIIQGLPISIENPVGSERSGVDKDGNKWSIRVTADYGEIEGTLSADGDPIDVFIGSNPDSEVIFVVDQVLGSKFDEHKCMIGFSTASEAKAAYLSNYQKGWKGLGDLTTVSIADFKEWIKHGDTTKPFSKHKLHESNAEESLCTRIMTEIFRTS